MTIKDADLLAERMTKIWSPVSFEVDYSIDSEDGFPDFMYSATIDDGIELQITLADPVRDNEKIYEILSKYIVLTIKDDFPWNVDTRTSGEGYGWKQRERDFVARWLPVLRRGCWLSGCPIEATSHEKAEWIQGFSYEEIRGWNLSL